ncbi:Pycsar system effector family protein [Adhaeribacter aquaticus]|uniref:Pycsar system effector family protein n=1 Tax=Adhaeribacter aquaticus TaxID=299567 RepID=UPI000425B32D|nr:Pycsar system effector family protein [Adhaeribacter aquaticus]
MSTVGLLYKTSAYVRKIYVQNPRKEFTYHNLKHTEEVVRMADVIAGQFSLTETDYLALLIAAWFHDVGYLFTSHDLHEEKSAEMAASFLREESSSENFITEVQKAIMATKMPQNPVSEIGKILADADVFHFGTSHFQFTDRQVKEETELRIKQEITNDVWYNIGFKLLEKHEFQTEYCRKLLAEGKNENLQRLKVLASEAEQAKSIVPEKPNEADKPKIKDKENKAKKPERGVETMFRITAANHMHLSDMADNKAHILLTINSVIVSVIVSFLFRKISDEPHFLIPAILFLITSLVTLVAAILVTMPSVQGGTITLEDIKRKKGNLLFFGNFYNMRFEDYEFGINVMMEDKDYLYGSMIRDNFNLGLVLEKKYKKLRFAYAFFMFGFVISVISFMIAEFFSF